MLYNVTLTCDNPAQMFHLQVPPDRNEAKLLCPEVSVMQEQTHGVILLRCNEQPQVLLYRVLVSDDFRLPPV